MESARYHARVRASALLSMPPTNRTVMLNRVTAAQSSDESDGWAAANNRIAPRHSAEAISKVEAMEAARQQAEAKAQADEEEWRQEELRLQKEEEARREAREIAEEEEERRVEEQWEAERAIALMVLDASNTGPADEAMQSAVEWGTEAAAVAAAAVAAAGAPSASAPEVERAAELAAASEAIAELLRREANRKCFDCEKELRLASGCCSSSSSAPAATVDAGSSSSSGGDVVDAAAVATAAREILTSITTPLWCCTSHGVLLCADCGRIHETLGEKASTVRPHDASLELTDLDSCFAGGNEAFATYLAEEVGVPRHVWLALPLDARYATPAAELYQRRLKAFMSGEAELPTDLNVPPKSPSPTRRASDDGAAAAEPKQHSWTRATVDGHLEEAPDGGDPTLVVDV